MKLNILEKKLVFQSGKFKYWLHIQAGDYFLLDTTPFLEQKCFGSKSLMWDFQKFMEQWAKITLIKARD